MSIIELLRDAPIVSSIGWTLIHFVWQGFLIALVLRATLRMIARRDANTRYVVSTVAMLALVVAPIVTFLSVHDAPPTTSSAVTEGIRAVPDHSVGASTNAAVQPVQPDSPAERTGSFWSATSDLPARVTAYLHSAIPWLVAAWLIGALLLSGRLLVGWCYTRSLRSRMVSPVGEALQHRFDALRERVGVGRPVRLVKSALVRVPCVIGYLKPVVLLPASVLTGLSRQQLDAIIVHELAHIRRHDQLVNFLQTIAEAVLFYHPAVWWISDQIRVERENCCDDLAVSVSGNLRTYVLALTHLEEHRSVPNGFALAASDASLLSRVKRLLNVSQDSSAPDRRSWAGSLATVLLVSAVLVGAGIPGPELEAASPTIFPGEAPFSGALAQHGDPIYDASLPRRGESIANDARRGESIANDTRPRHGDSIPDDARSGGEAVDAKLFLDMVDQGEVASATYDSGTETRKHYVARSPETAPLDDDKVVQALIAALADADGPTRARIAHALGMRESPEAIDALSNLLEHDEVGEVRRTAAWALGKIEDPQAIPALVNTLSREGEEESVLHQTIWALGMIEDEAAATALGALLDHGDAEIRSQAAWSLGMIESPEAVPQIVDRLQREPDSPVKVQLIWALGMIEDERAVDALIGSLDDDDREVRSQAAWALGMIESPRAVDALIRRFEAEADLDIKVQIAHALGMIEDERAVEVLAEAISSDDPELRRAAISALGMMAGPNPNPNPNPNQNRRPNPNQKPGPNSNPNPNPNPNLSPNPIPIRGPNPIPNRGPNPTPNS